MADLNEGADSAAAATTPIDQGTAALPNDQTPAASDAGASPSPEDAERQRWLESLDPEKLPAATRQKLEAPFKADHTKKTQELAEERRQNQKEREDAFATVRKLIDARDSVPAGPSALEVKIKQLKELAAAGDGDAIEALADLKAEMRTQPIQNEIRWSSAVGNAMADPDVGPTVKAHYAEIRKTMEEDPGLRELATFGGYKYAGRIMVALGLEHQNREIKAERTTLQAELAATKAKLAAYEKERVTSLPASTSRTGTTSGRTSAGDSQNIYDAARRAWIDSGMPESEFR